VFADRPATDDRQADKELRPHVLKGGRTGVRNAGGAVRRPVPVPAGPDATMVAIATEHGWDGERIEEQFAEFVKFNRAKGNAWPDWSYPWGRWIKRAIEREQQTRSMRTTTGTSMVDMLVATAAAGGRRGFGDYAL